MNKEEKKLKRPARRRARKEKRKATRGEFKKFILRGNIVDLAVAVAVGSAFTAIVNSLVKDIIGGVMGWLMGDVNLEELAIYLGTGEDAPAIISFTKEFTIAVKALPTATATAKSTTLPLNMNFLNSPLVAFLLSFLAFLASNLFNFFSSLLILKSS